MTVFAVVISITKDLADIEGDKKFNIDTFATKLGVKGVSYLGSGLLLANYVGAVGMAVARAGWFNQPLMIGAHCVFAFFLIVKTKALETEGSPRRRCRGTTRTSGTSSTPSTSCSFPLTRTSSRARLADV